MSTILHVDMDAFFAAVEQLDNPQYLGKPLIIGGTKDSIRGVVSTCSYEARKYGVHSAMPLRQAITLCPHGIYIRGRMERYQAVSRKIHQIFPDFSPVVEPLSIDEAFLDMTGCEHFYTSLEDMGKKLKQQIKEKTGITASVGIAPNKFLAKLASDLRKPNGLVIIRPDDIDKILLDLPVGKLWGVGDKSQKLLHQYKIYTVGDLRQHSEQWLTERLGKLGSQVYYLARGIDSRKVEPRQEVKSIGQEQTFSQDISDPEILKSQIALLVEKVGWRLRKQELFAKTITLKVRYSDFSTFTRGYTLNNPIQDDDSIYHTAIHLFKEVRLEPIRLLGVTASNLSDHQQISLFSSDQKSSELSKVMDRINDKYDVHTLRKGRTLSIKKEAPKE